mmetsp:Transcript_11595/g.30187  ORF Transcript_11595/g.30187 Transcript_11595/m.30187 type:complete len:236 (-) Transcript_11595:597-1304(-)
MTGPNCSSWKRRILGVTASTMAGVISAPASSPPPRSAFASRAPLPSASPMSSSRYFGLPGSGSGVIATLGSQGRPALSAPTLSTSLATNASAIESCTMISLIAVHRWPLYDVAPSVTCWTATSRSASGSTMPMFLPASCANTLRRWGSGCSFTTASIALVPPMKPSTSTRPERMIGGIVLRPEPLTKFTTPGGRALANASAVRMCTRPPVAGSLMTAVLPMISAGMSIAYISLSG